jgi:integrase
MPIRAKGVTAAQVEKGTKPGRYGDGAGLYLLVRSKEAKFWLFRYKQNGKMREMGLGPATGRTAVPLSAARERARELHAVVRAGRDPLDERDAEKAKADADAAKAKAGAMTFAQVADMYIAAHEASWRNPKHRKQWRATLDQYAMPQIGNLPVDSVDTGTVIKIIEPLWREKTQTASRLRGRIEAVLDYAKARGWREGENPVRWRGHLDQLLPNPRKVQRVEHHAALPWREIGAFMQRLRCTFSASARCLEFLILTACRSGEARFARLSEIDFDRAVWTIPAERIKAGQDHRVPLSQPALDVLRTMAQFGDEGIVFPGLKTASTLSDVVLTSALHAAGGGSTVHGFRSTFRDWCGECTNYPRELAELSLAHKTFVGDAGETIGSAVELAYKRGDQLERRRRLMADWAAFCDRPMVAGEVIPLPRAAGG